MITKVSFKNVASYKKESVLETDKKVNLIYGLNGTGKTTLSSYFYNPLALKYIDCTADGIEENDTILVYNQDFIHDTFYESMDIPGIFTISKVNADNRKFIDSTNKEINELINKKSNLEALKKQEEQKYLKEEKKYKENIWKIKTDYYGSNSPLSYCLHKVTKSQDALLQYLASMENDSKQINYTIAELRKEAETLTGDAQSKQLLEQVTIALHDIEQSELLKKVIVGNANSSVAELINKLGNSDWLNAGIKYVHMDGEYGKCPFCQQNTITHDFLKQVNDYFDESYKKDLESIGNYINDYNSEIKRISDYLNELKRDTFYSNYVKDIDNLLADLNLLLMNNISVLKEKLDAPSLSVTLQSITTVENNINSLIKKINDEILKYNQRISNLVDSREALNKKFWALMRDEYNSVIELYLKGKKAYDQFIRAKQKEIDLVNVEVQNKRKLIEDKAKDKADVEEAVKNIKQGLVDIGITDFTIELYSENDALYRLKRDRDDIEVFETLSEGEKMVISFLYFIELCKGESSPEKNSANKIVVIDDPISSLSHIYVFNIGRLIHNEFLRTDKYNQIFILTHSLYFFYELTNTKKEEREETQKLFRICKNETGSYFTTMKYEEIQNDYQSYWQIIKDKNSPPALIANCMRNIMEYFFNFVEKQDFNNVFQKPELQQIRFNAFNRYMNRESHSKGQNIFDIKEFDYDSFRDAFKKVFELTDYMEHYNKMMK